MATRQKQETQETVEDIDGYCLEEEAEKTRELTTTVGAAKIKYHYRENAFTPELEDIARGDRDEAIFDTPTVLLMLKSLIASWDVSKTKADKKNKVYVPVTDEYLKRIPKRLLIRMLNDIGDDLNPNVSTAETS